MKLLEWIFEELQRGNYKDLPIGSGSPQNRNPSAKILSEGLMAGMDVLQPKLIETGGKLEGKIVNTFTADYSCFFAPIKRRVQVNFQACSAVCYAAPYVLGETVDKNLFAWHRF